MYTYKERLYIMSTSGSSTYKTPLNREMAILLNFLTLKHYSRDVLPHNGQSFHTNQIVITNPEVLRIQMDM